jgi:8-oxo-dGTP pyrophosphatase MutT (NUDIX family)
MYKVFINQKIVIFTETAQFDSQLINNKNVLSIQSTVFAKANFDLLLADNKQNMFIVCNHLEKVWKDFTKKMKVIKAGGGLVLNKKYEMLFIFRRGKWDLPKGKLDKGEKIAACALREVKEECGIKSLQIDSKLCNTYHVYFLKEKPVLKITSWYLMHLTKKEQLVPQIEEDITDIRFISMKKYKSTIKKKTFPLIAGLIDSLPPNISSTGY